MPDFVLRRDAFLNVTSASDSCDRRDDVRLRDHRRVRRLPVCKDRNRGGGRRFAQADGGRGARHRGVGGGDEDRGVERAAAPGGRGVVRISRDGDGADRQRGIANVGHPERPSGGNRRYRCCESARLGDAENAQRCSPFRDDARGLDGLGARRHDRPRRGGKHRERVGGRSPVGTGTRVRDVHHEVGRLPGGDDARSHLGIGPRGAGRSTSLDLYGRDGDRLRARVVDSDRLGRHVAVERRRHRSPGSEAQEAERHRLMGIESGSSATEAGGEMDRTGFVVVGPVLVDGPVLVVALVLVVCEFEAVELVADKLVVEPVCVACEVVELVPSVRAEAVACLWKQSAVKTRSRDHVRAHTDLRGAAVAAVEVLQGLAVPHAGLQPLRGIGVPELAHEILGTLAAGPSEQDGRGVLLASRERGRRRHQGGAGRGGQGAEPCGWERRGHCAGSQAEGAGKGD
ncbi:hypothetical protein DFJ74DRAFT_668141 [Hyaloraphidium curvatum]|nr:hypothetical protein DFJ74DRAFT_668141 [Hyaloraphidium curvatum]